MESLKKIFMFCFFMFFMTSICYADSDSTSSAVKLKLLSQNPDPVKSGDDVILRFVVENVGGEDIDDYYVEFVDNYPFSLFPDEKRQVYVGKLFANSVSKDNNAQIVKFKVKVFDDVSEGFYPVKVLGFKKGKNAQESEFNVEISSEANAEISSISVDTLVPGVKTKIVFGIKNVGKSDLENVKFSWNSQDDIILPVGSGNFKYIDKISPKEEFLVEFFVVSDLNTEPKLYKLDLNLEYDDIESLQKITDAGEIKNEKRREVNSKAGIYVGGRTDFEINFKEIRDGESSFSITNIGSNLADSVVLKVVNYSNFWNFLGSDSVVVGKIKKGAFARATFNLKPEFEGIHDLHFVVEYTDTTGKRQKFDKILSLDSSLFKESILSKANLNNYEEKTDNSKRIFFISFLVLLCVFGFIYFRRKKKNSKKNNI